MTERTFALWVEPVAATLAEGRRQVIGFVRSAPPGIWERASDVETWTYKDILAHLAGGNDQMLQTLLRKVIAREPLDSSIMDVDTDDENARRVAERRPLPFARLIAELEADGDEVQEMLSQLSEADEQLREGLPITLGAFLQIVEHERHDLIHLEQLRRALADD